MNSCRHVEQYSKISELRVKVYNEEVVNMKRRDECAICLDSMECGQRIARLSVYVYTIRLA